MKRYEPETLEDLREQMLNEVAYFLDNHGSYKEIVRAIDKCSKWRGDNVNLDNIMMFGLGPEYSYDKTREKLNVLSQKCIINQRMGGTYDLTNAGKLYAELQGWTYD